MRLIKFRGKRIDNGEWVYGFWGNRPDGANFICPFENYQSYAVIPETVGQYCGLLDKNKVEIFEGDIIKDFINGTTEIVEFRHGIFGSKSIDGKTWGGMFDEPEQYEVIGNIYENENFLSNFELLTNKKQ